MEVFRTDDFYILVKNEHSLWWDRQTGAFIPKTGWDLADADDPQCIGVCYGLIGKVEHPSVFDPRLILIKDCAAIGKIHGNNEIFQIKAIAFLHLSKDNSDVGLRACPKHKTMPMQKKLGPSLPFIAIQNTAVVSKTLGGLKSAGNAIRNTTQQAAAAISVVSSPLRKDAIDKEKFERQIMDEFHKIFTDTSSFYFSPTCDVTSSLQRLCEISADGKESSWKTVDDRFFWNKWMVGQLMELNNNLVNPWILPIIQGYINIEECKVEVDQDYSAVKTSPKYEIFKICILSRRSRFRAGTRYKRRGVDEHGQCANYVETEQIIAYQHHEVSFVQVRGSVPVYWSQPGYKYRPPPRIDKGGAETKVAFENHFAQEIARYGPVCIVNLVDQTGKEKVIWDAYSHHVFEFNSPEVTYVTFDFHEYCRGMHFENVSVLINSIADIIKDMNYCWRDKHGTICKQSGVFRVNCIDCLDRTNVVQTALAKSVMELQFCKLGLISPDGQIPETIKATFQRLWANNGDIISKQYAGTNALKGDYTRTGERKFTGIMKDGMNSANRYYRSHFTSTLRQCSLDLLLGNTLDPVEIHQLFVCDIGIRLQTVGNIASELLPPLLLSSGDAHFCQIALQQEYDMANMVYHMCRYYLSRFKDAQRQATIDLMLGNFEEETFIDGKTSNFEEDVAATAEHVKLLIEDSKKMLINNPQIVLGAWGLINADPVLGDPNETEMDSIVILTKTSYFMADYDDQVDKVTKYQEVLLTDLTILESGFPETGNTLFKNNKLHYCIRLNYKVNGIGGYYHMFRSTNLRFFNNMAVQIKNEEEEIESLKAICEAFVVAINVVCGSANPIPYVHGRKLDKKKSKVLSSGGHGIYLDITGLPQITRNVSETQLLALKQAGSKALSNVTQQFSKLNKLSFKPRKNQTGNSSQQVTQPKFHIGTSPNNCHSPDHSDDSDEESDNSIFQPNVTTTIVDGKLITYNTDSGSSVDTRLNDLWGGTAVTGFGVGSVNVLDAGVEAMEGGSGGMSAGEGFLESVGIVMSGEQIVVEQTASGGPSQVDSLQLARVIDTVSLQNKPEIQISSNNELTTSTYLQQLDRTHSHSIGNVQPAHLFPTNAPPQQTKSSETMQRSSSERDVVMLNISSSQSESALKNKVANLTSPMTFVTRDLVLSPFSKIGKGLQTLGANLDRRIGHGGGMVRQITEREYEEHRQLQEKWRNSKTRLIAL